MEIIEEQVKRLTQTPSSGLSFGAAIGVLTALWSANQGSRSAAAHLDTLGKLLHRDRAVADTPAFRGRRPS